jgi:hypothetical protein
MGNVIDFLERLGQDAQLRYATGGEVDEALQQAQIDPAVRAAILADDRHQLEALLGAQPNVCCMVHVPDDEEDEDDDQDDSDDDTEDDESTSRQSTFRRVAAAF